MEKDGDRNNARTEGVMDSRKGDENPWGEVAIKKSLSAPFDAGRLFKVFLRIKILQELYILRGRAFLALRDVETHTLALG
jgi:hypothetical protein